MAEPEHAVLSKEELVELIDKTVETTLTKLGCDLRDPFEMQRDFTWLRERRLVHASNVAKVRTTVISVLAASGLAALWAFIKLSLSS